MHYFKFNVADYKADTAHLDVIEHGIYFQLICWYYLDEKQIPLETQVVIRRLSLDGEMIHKLENVLADFFVKTEKGYYHSRVESELEKYRTQFAKNRINGLDGGRPRKNPSGLQKNPSAPLTTNHKPVTSNQINSKTLSDNSDKLLLEFLNSKTDRGYRPVTANLKLIQARLKEYSFEDLKAMIAKKSREWKSDEVMNKYLRPATLFNATKCAQYIGELVKV